MQMKPYPSFKGDCEAAFRFYEQSLGVRPGPMFRYGGTPMEAHVSADWSGPRASACSSIGSACRG